MPKPKPTPQTSYEFFVQDQYGDHNLEKQYTSREACWEQVRLIREQGGYWMTDRNENQVFVPWHRVDFVRISEVKE